MIQVALATCNSELYLPALLDSLFGQTCQDFLLLVADDDSTDSTLDILDREAALHPGRIRILSPEATAGSALANFSRLIDNLTADYVLFCDHDDVWLPDKIALSLEAMRALEEEHGRDMPLLVHTDLTVVDSDLEILGDSSFDYQGIDPTRNDLGSLLVVNTVSGCAAMANRALYEAARPIPREAIMHDHWLALVAAALGRIRCIENSTVLYRQHGGNAIGATRWSAPTILRRIRETLLEDTKRRLVQRFCGQAAALLVHCGAAMTPEQYRTTAALADLWRVGRWQRIPLLRRNGLLLNGFIRNSALFIAVTMAPRAGAGAGAARQSSSKQAGSLSTDGA